MPNTLAHIGALVLPWKLIDRKADIKWLGLGCIVPDFPWILQRLTASLVPGIDLLDLRIYCLIQASLFFCLLISAAISLLARNSAAVFLILAGSSLVHLLLDAAQTKWANGVHFFVPLSWRMSQFQLFWPENNITLILTCLGLAALVFYGWHDRSTLIDLQISVGRLSGGVALLLIYLVLPLGLFDGPLQADNHYVRTLRDHQQRVGQPVGFDRCHYDHRNQTIRIFTKEVFKVKGLHPEEDATISLIGRFSDNSTVYIETLHQHSRARDFYSIAGLTILMIVWGTAVIKAALKKTGNTSVSSNLSI